MRLSATVFFTGLLGIGFETVSVRVLSQVLENTVYTFAVVLAVFLWGTATGAALYQRWAGLRIPAGQARAGARGLRALPAASPPLLLADLLCGISLACMFGVLALWKAQPLRDACRAAAYAPFPELERLTR